LQEFYKILRIYTVDVLIYTIWSTKNRVLLKKTVLKGGIYSPDKYPQL